MNSDWFHSQKLHHRIQTRSWWNLFNLWDECSWQIKCRFWIFEAIFGSIWGTNRTVKVFCLSKFQVPKTAFRQDLTLFRPLKTPLVWFITVVSACLYLLRRLVILELISLGYQSFLRAPKLCVISNFLAIGSPFSKHDCALRSLWHFQFHFAFWGQEVIFPNFLISSNYLHSSTVLIRWVALADLYSKNASPSTFYFKLQSLLHIRVFISSQICFPPTDPSFAIQFPHHFSICPSCL